MHFKSFICSAVLLATSFVFTIASASGDVVLFDGAVQEGGLFANGDIELDSDTFVGDTVIKFTPTGSFQNGGLEFFGGYTIPSGERFLRISARSTDSGNLNGFSIDMDTGNFDLASDVWTLNGAPGDLSDFTANTWHEIEIDLESISGFTSGTSRFNNFVTIKNNTGTGPFFIRDITLVSAIPEPSSLALVALGSFGLLVHRRRK